uniref:Uncharacterized protein n=1 Tax=Nicotiana tabacum TaxID=4097 RepID=A0A1S3YDF9_TOBAC|nr:PREDICTED: uncharacterized protein LOC107775081 [Nicotiana tabacum]
MTNDGSGEDEHRRELLRARRELTSILESTWNMKGQSKVCPVEKEPEKQAKRSRQVRSRGVGYELVRKLKAVRQSKSAAGSAVESAAADGRTKAKHAGLIM